MATVELRFSALPEHVRTARLVAAAVARRAGVDEAVLDEVRLAVGEACTRAVGLHRNGGITAPVKVLLIEEEKQFSIEVGDEVPHAVPGGHPPGDGGRRRRRRDRGGRDGPRGHQRPRRRRRGQCRGTRRIDPHEVAHHAADHPPGLSRFTRTATLSDEGPHTWGPSSCAAVSARAYSGLVRLIA
ncbi:hypothetical protein SGRIM128S_09761 [Streptomyces griseomycini]